MESGILEIQLMKYIIKAHFLNERRMIIRNYISVGSPLLVRNSGGGEKDVGVVLQVPAKLWCVK